MKNAIVILQWHFSFIAVLIFRYQNFDKSLIYLSNGHKNLIFLVVLVLY